jgi:hypothetical protein
MNSIFAADEKRGRRGGRTNRRSAPILFVISLNRAKKEGRKKTWALVVMKVSKPPEGNSWCGGRGGGSRQMHPLKGIW